MTNRRKSFDIPGFGHGDNPIPAVSRIGNIVMTGGVYGLDFSTGKIPESLDEQVANMFQLADKVLQAAGASLDDVIKVTVFLKPDLSRAAINKEWLRCFPDPHSRPVRHTVVNPYLAGGMLVQCELTAVVGP
jgi:2-iminobutanoate/2-iminopropanoate deaminase